MCEAAQCKAKLVYTADGIECAATVPLQHGFDGIEQESAINHAEQGLHGFIVHLLAGEGDHLVKGGESVAHAAFALSGNQAETAVGDGQLLSIRDLAHPTGNSGQGDLAEVETLTA